MVCLTVAFDGFEADFENLHFDLYSCLYSCLVVFSKKHRFLVQVEGLSVNYAQNIDFTAKLLCTKSYRGEI